VELLAPARVGVQVDNRVIWRIDGQEVDPASIWHVKAFTAPGQVLGLSPIQHARQAIGLGIGAERYAARFFGESAIPSGVLTSDQDIKQDRAEQLKARWKQAHTGHRDIAVLGQGARFQAVTIPPEQAQFLESTRANVATIARYFGVQPELIGGESGGASPTPTWNSAPSTSSPLACARGWSGWRSPCRRCCPARLRSSSTPPPS
jgi:HK97 family phage portal protein